MFLQTKSASNFLRPPPHPPLSARIMKPRRRCTAASESSRSSVRERAWDFRGGASCCRKLIYPPPTDTQLVSSDNTQMHSGIRTLTAGVHTHFKHVCARKCVSDSMRY